MVVVVGGHSRNIGKTSVVAGLIRALPEAAWTAVKITQHEHGRPYALSEETEGNASDSGRFLAAGAVRSYWLRTPAGKLAEAAAEIRGIVERSRNTILESNSVMEFLHPGLYLAVLDYSIRDMKDSARRYLPLADALIVSGEEGSSAWTGFPPDWPAGKPRFPVSPPAYMTPELVSFVAAKLD